MKNATTSLIWSFVEKISVQGLSFMISLILARLLMPEDYGLIAILSIFISVATVFIDGGFSNALIQNQKRTDKDFSTVFYINICVATICYSLLYLISPFLAGYFEQSLLEDVCRIYGLSLIISSFSLVQKARFYINYDFRSIAMISLFAIVVGGVTAIYMAYNGYGVWALVWYHIIVEIIRTICLWICSKWKPTITFSIDSFISIWKFGSKLLCANIINVISSNVYTFVIGKKFSASNLGFYSRGQSMSYVIPSNLSNIMTQASYPVLCEVQNDSEQLRTYFLKYITLSFAIIVPIMSLVASLATPIVNIILTEKWLSSVPYIQILAIAYVFDPVMRLNANVINVTGHSEYSIFAEIFKKIALLFILIISSQFGIYIMVWGIVVYNILDLLIVSFYVRKVVRIGFIDEMFTLLPFLIYGGSMWFCIYLLISNIENNYLQLVVGIILGAFIYLILIFLFSKSVIDDVLKIIKRK